MAAHVIHGLLGSFIVVWNAERLEQVPPVAKNGHPNSEIDFLGGGGREGRGFLVGRDPKVATFIRELNSTRVMLRARGRTVISKFLGGGAGGP